MKNGKVSIIVLNWNGWKDTIECLESIFQVDYPDFQVIVVDNGSTEGSIDKIVEWANGKMVIEGKYSVYSNKNKPIRHCLIQSGSAKNDAPLMILRSNSNLGYAAGNNLGIRYSFKGNPEYIMVLNNDIVVKRDFLSELIKGFQCEAKVGMVAPKAVDYFTGWFRNYPSLKRFNSIKYIFSLTPLNVIVWRLRVLFIRLRKQFLSPTKVYMMGGFCLLFKREVIEEIGLFDENTFLGSEEFIIAEKLLKKGYSTYFMPQSIVYHKIGQSTKELPSIGKTIAFLNSENYLLNNYIKFDLFSRLIIRLIRLSIILFRSIFNQDYRNNLSKVIKIIFE